MYLGYQNEKIKFYTEEMLNPSFYQLDRQEYTDKEYVLDGDEYVLKDEAWEEKQAQKERERIGNLTCTKRVFALMLQELGISYLQLKELIATNEQAQLEWDLSVQLERGNPLIDIFGEQLGVTREQIDILFKVANGEATVGDLQKTIKNIDPEENLNNEVI